MKKKKWQKKKIRKTGGVKKRKFNIDKKLESEDRPMDNEM